MRYLLLILAVLLSFGFVAIFKPKKTLGLRFIAPLAGHFYLLLPFLICFLRPILPQIPDLWGIYYDRDNLADLP